MSKYGIQEIMSDSEEQNEQPPSKPVSKTKTDDHHQPNYPHYDYQNITESIDYGHFPQYPGLHPFNSPKKQQPMNPVKQAPQINRNSFLSDDDPSSANYQNSTKRQSISQSSEDQIHNSNTKKSYNQNQVPPSSSDSSSDWQPTDQIKVNQVKIHKSSKDYLFDDIDQSNPKNSQEDDDNVQIQIGKSMFTESPAQLMKRPEQKMQMKIPEHLQMFGQNASEIESVYMKTGIELKHFDMRLYWKVDIKRELEIEKKILDMVIEEFLGSDILLPIISEQQFNLDFNIKLLYFQKYTNLLNAFQYEKFKEVVGKISMNKKNIGESSTFTSLESQADLNNGGLKGVYDKYIGNFFGGADRYSKAELLRNHLVQKLKSLRRYHEIIIDLQKDPKENDQREKQNRKIQNNLQDQIANLQILISFEQSQKYCRAKSEKLQKKIWKQRLRKIQEMKKNWINQTNLPKHIKPQEMKFQI